MKTCSSISDPSLKASVRDGVSCAIMLGAGESYLGAYGIFLKASAFQVGLLGSLPLLAGAIFQLLGLRLMHWAQRRRALLVAIGSIQGLFWIPIAALALVPEGLGARTWILIVLVAAYFACSGLTGPIWNSLIGDLIPAGSKGRYFGRRSRAVGIATCVSMIVAGKILDQTALWAIPTIGFATVFTCCAVARAFSVFFISQHRDPKVHHHKDEQNVRAYQGGSRLRSNIAQFAIFTAAMNFSANVAGPYFAMYMLNDLHLSYWSFTLISSSVVIAQILTLQHWGELSDIYGNKKIMTISAWGIALCPFLWLTSSHVAALVLIEMFTGFVWAGFSLGIGNFLFDAVNPSVRPRWSAYTSLANGCATFLGGLVGALFVSFGFFKTVGLSQFMLVFLVSGLLRLAVVWIMLPRVQEVREVAAISHGRLFFHIVQLGPLAEITFKLITWRNRSR